MRLERGSSRIRRFFGVGLVVLGSALVMAVSSVPSAFTGGPGGGAISFASTGTFPAAAEYAVVFTETGLPTGTSWSVTLNGTLQSSTTTSMSFEEPNGGYVFTVAPVSGYTTSGPEGNITVAGAPQSFGVEFASTTQSQACPSFFWSGANNSLSGNCLGSFEADYRSYDASSGFTFINSTFTVGPFAEVTSSGTVVALGVPGFDGSGSVTIASSPDEINVTDTIVGTVTNAIGVNSSTGDPNGATPQWTPTDLAGFGGTTTWGAGSQVLGTITIQIVFHFDNGSANGTPRVKFDISVGGWPWVSSSDELGLVVESEAFALPGGSHFTYAASTDTISQQWNTNGGTISSLNFGPTADTTGSSPSVLHVGDQVDLLPSGATPTMAGALLTFAGAGGYPNMTYDPYVEFGPLGTIPISLAPGPAPNAVPWLPVLVTVGAASTAGLLLGVYAQRVRRRPIEEGLRQAS
jgi:hypothetical protein